MVTVPLPYDMRHSFASLLLAEGRTVHYVAAQLGHSPTLTLTVYGHLFSEFEGAARIDAEAEIQAAREAPGVLEVHNSDALPEGVSALNDRTPVVDGRSERYPQRESNSRYQREREVGP